MGAEQRRLRRADRCIRRVDDPAAPIRQPGDELVRVDAGIERRDVLRPANDEASSLVVGDQP
jgi:hypothetical protein